MRRRGDRKATILELVDKAMANLRAHDHMVTSPPLPPEPLGPLFFFWWGGWKEDN